NGNRFHMHVVKSFEINGVTSPEMRQIPAEKNQISVGERLHAVPHQPHAASFADKRQFRFRMKMPVIVQISIDILPHAERCIVNRIYFAKNWFHKNLHWPTTNIEITF